MQHFVNRIIYEAQTLSHRLFWPVEPKGFGP